MMTHEKIPTKGSIGRGAIWSLSNQFVGQFLVLAIFLVTARFVPQEDFGIMAVCYLVVEFFRQIMIESIGSTLIARHDAGDKDYNAGFAIIMTGCALSALLIYISAPLFAELLNHEEYEYGLRLTCLILLTMGLSKIHEVWLMKKMNFRLLTIRSVISTSIGGAVGIYMAVKGYGLEALIAQQIITSLLSTLTLWATTSWRPSFKTDLATIGSILGFSRFVSLSAVMAFISSQSDVFFASYYLGAAATGVYNAAKRILVAMNLIFVSGLNSVAFPAIAAQGRHDNYKETFMRGVTYSAVLTAPIYVGLVVLSHDIVVLLLGNKWIEAAPIISILAINGFLSSIELYSNNTRMIYNKPHWQTFINTASAITNLIVMYTFAKYGLHILAFALAGKTLFMYPLSLGMALRLIDLRVRDYIRGLFPMVFSALIMGCSIKLLHSAWGFESSLANLAVLVPCGTLIYFGILYVLKKSILHDLVDAAKHIKR